MLEVKDLEKTYESRSGVRVKALKGISLNFPEKGMVFILGKSGSGKSTLLNLLGGLDCPTGGEIIVDGRSSKNFSNKDFDVYRNNRIGFIFQEFNLIDNYTVGVNIALAAELQGKKASRSAVDAVLRELDLTDGDGNTLYERRINELSGGQKQRVAIARALIKNPQIILADEPTGALDSESGTELYELFARLSSDRLIIIVSHDTESAKQYGDRIIELRDGTIVSETILREKGQIAAPDYYGTALGKLPLKRTLSMGLAGFGCKPLRLAISVILAVISFTFACFATVSATTDVMTAELKTAYKNGAKTAVITADSVCESYTKYSDGHTNRNTFECTPTLTEEQIELLSETDDCTVMKIVPSWVLPAGIGIGNLGRRSAPEKYNPYNNLSAGGFRRVVELNSESGETDACLKPDARLTVECRLPQNFNEIAITDYWADMYIRFGFADSSGVLHKITSPDDLIGRTIEGGFTICGIYSTEEDKEWLKQYDYNEYNYEYVTNDYLRRWLDGEHSMSYAFVNDGYCAENFPDVTTYDMLYRLSGNAAIDKKLIDKISYSYCVEWLPEENLGSYTRLDYSISAAFRTRYAGYVAATEFLRDELFLTAATIISIVFAVFSALLLMNFLFADMAVRKRELGILRSLGARTFDVVKICMIESFATACIDFVLSLILTGVACVILNAKYSFGLFVVGIIPLASLLLLCFGTAALATIVPAVRLAVKKPIDVINNK